MQTNCRNLRTIATELLQRAKQNIVIVFAESYHLRIYGCYGNGCLAQKALSRKLDSKIIEVFKTFKSYFRKCLNTERFD